MFKNIKIIPVAILFVIITIVGCATFLSYRKGEIIYNNTNTDLGGTYNNDKYNYVFTYPVNLTIIDGKYNQNDVFFKDSVIQTPDVIHIAVSSTDLRGFKTIDDWIKSYSQEGYIKGKDIVIDNVQGIIVDIKIGDEVISGNKKIVFIKNDFIFEISFHQVSDAVFTIENAIDAFIEGFKFEK